ncbi:MAG: hypothetical protein P8Y36_07455 [Alphaproteobacteria bacterium]
MDEEQKLLRVHLGTQASYEHFFGHDASLEGLFPPGGELSAHLLLTLDTRDPLLAHLKLNSIRHFRLAHPFHYSQGETFAYRQSEGSIEFIKPSWFGKYVDWPEGSIDWPAYYGAYPTHFKTVPATLEIAQPTYDDDFDLTIILGSAQESLRQQSGEPICPVCSKLTRLIARMPDEIEGVAATLWGGNYVDTLFWYCDTCQIVLTHNECS